jgi:acyl-CoA thioester hydrolase
VPSGRHHHRIRIRYGEVDQQGVVFNAHYLAYCDDAMDTWLRQLAARFEDLGYDIMLKKATVEWQGSAGVGDELDIAVGVDRWGTTSLEVGFDGRVGERPVFTASIVYVGVKHGTAKPAPPPAVVREFLGEP